MLEKMLCSNQLTTKEEKREARRLQWYAVGTGLIMVVIITILSQTIKEVFKDSSAAFNVFFSALIMLVAMTYCYAAYLARVVIKQQFRDKQGPRE